MKFKQTRVNGGRSRDPVKASSERQSDGHSNKLRPSRLVAQSAAALLSRRTRTSEVRDHRYSAEVEG